MRLISRFLIPAIFLTVFTLPNLANAQEKLNEEKLDNYLSTLAEYKKMMGTVAISKDGEIIYNESFGYAKNTENKIYNANTTTKYRIGSISKMFTAVMTLQLIEEGKLSLSTKLSKYFPDVVNAETIAIRHLLTHQSGLHNLTNDPEYMDYYTQEMSRQDMLDIITQLDADFLPGEVTAYSNTNFVLLGYIIEEITGKTYAEALEGRIIEKADLDQTAYGKAPEPEENEASSFKLFNGTWEEQPETNMSIPHGAGAVVSTAVDLTNFIEALFKGELISNELLDTMLTTEDGFGMGIFEKTFEDHNGYGHSGGIDGFVSTLSYFPDENLSVAITTNALNYSINDLWSDVLSIYYNTGFSIPEFSKPVTFTKQQLQKYEGVYSSEKLPMNITIRIDGNHLTAQGTGQPPFPLEAKDEQHFLFGPANIDIRFEAPENNSYESFHLLQNGAKYLFEKESDLN